MCVRVCARANVFFSDEYRSKYFPLLFKYHSIENDTKASEEFIRGNTELLHEHATGWLLLRCIDLEMEGKSSDMKRVARQEMLLQYIMDLAGSMKQDPRAAVAYVPGTST